MIFKALSVNVKAKCELKYSVKIYYSFKKVAGFTPSDFFVCVRCVKEKCVKTVDF